MFVYNVKILKKRLEKEDEEVLNVFANTHKYARKLALKRIETFNDKIMLPEYIKNDDELIFEYLESDGWFPIYRDLRDGTAYILIISHHIQKDPTLGKHND